MRPCPALLFAIQELNSCTTTDLQSLAMGSAAGDAQDAVAAETAAATVTAAAGQTVSAAAAAAEDLLSAASQGQYHAAQHLLAHGLRPSSSTPGGWTALHAAAMEGHLQLLQLLVKHEAPVNACSNQGFTPLHSASRAGHKGSVDLLLASGAEVNAADQQGWTPLLLAIVGGHVEVVEMLLQHGADPDCTPAYDDECERTALHLATFVSADPRNLQQLMEANGSDIDMEELYLGSYAASDTKMLQLLLASGADANAKDELYEWGPLHYAAFCGSLEALQLLLDYGADVHAVSRSGSTALHAAATGGWVEVVKLLLSRGADVNARYPTNPKHSALALAASKGHLEIMEVLIARGADVNLLVAPGRRLLFYPARLGQVEALKLLLRKGAGRDGEQLIGAARIAATQGHRTAWAVLVRHALLNHPPEVFHSCLQGRRSDDDVRAMGRAWQEDVSNIEQQQAEVDKERLEVVEMKKCAQQLIVQGVMLQREGDIRDGHGKENAGSRAGLVLRVITDVLAVVAVVGGAGRVLKSHSTSRKMK